MDEFFEPLPPEEPEESRRRPPWLGAPRGTLSGVVALEVVLARTEAAAVCVSQLGAYPTASKSSS